MNEPRQSWRLLFPAWFFQKGGKDTAPSDIPLSPSPLLLLLSVLDTECVLYFLSLYFIWHRCVHFPYIIFFSFTLSFPQRHAQCQDFLVAFIVYSSKFTHTDEPRKCANGPFLTFPKLFRFESLTSEDISIDQKTNSIKRKRDTMD